MELSGAKELVFNTLNNKICQFLDKEQDFAIV
jgi:hypothetical protein